MTAEQLKQKFYELACSYYINVGSRAMSVSISGLAENMPEAMKLMEDFIANAKVDKDAYEKYVDIVEKSRADNKLNQRVNFSRLQYYGMYGKYNSALNSPSTAELKEMDPQKLVDMIKDLKNYKHSVLYYGPMDLKEFTAIVKKEHKTAKKLADVPQNKPYKMQQTTQNEVYIAPYDAKNIYMIQYHNDGKTWNAEQEPIAALFNEYYGGGMNSIVFQELREARGLAYSAFAMYGTPGYKDDTEYAYTYIISQNDKMMDCINTFNSILNTMPKSEKAFELSKQALMKRLATSRTTKFSIINAYLNAEDLGIDYDINKKIYEAVPSMTMDDVAKFEKEHMANKPYRYMILGDEKQLDMKALEKIGPVKRLTTEEIFGY